MASQLWCPPLQTLNERDEDGLVCFSWLEGSIMDVLKLVYAGRLVVRCDVYKLAQ